MPQDRQFEQQFKEGEPLPTVVITAVGYEHRFYNVQGLSTVFEQVRSSLSSDNSARNVVYLEDAGNTASEAVRRKRVVEEFGGLTGFLMHEAFVGQYGTEPDISYVEAMVRKIRSEVVRGDFSSIPLGSAQNFALNLGLEDLRVERHFEVVFEAQTPGVIKSDNASFEKYQKLLAEARIRWENGQFDESLRAFKKAKVEIHASGAARNPGIAQQVRALAKDLSSTPQGGNIVLVLGESHLPVIDMLQRQLGSVNPSIRFDKKRGRVFADSPEGKIDSALSARQQVSDLVYSQADVFALAIGDLAYMYSGGRDQTFFMTNYEDIYKQCADIVGRLSIDEIKQLCEGRAQLGQYFLGKLFPYMR